jgi:hypothetical protein
MTLSEPLAMSAFATLPARCRTWLTPHIRHRRSDRADHDRLRLVGSESRSPTLARHVALHALYLTRAGKPFSSVRCYPTTQASSSSQRSLASSSRIEPRSETASTSTTVISAARTVGLETIRARLRAPGQRIRIELRHGDQQRTVELRIWRVI